MGLTARSGDMEGEGGTLNLTPLLDMLFMLIIFFIVTSTFVEEEKDIEVQLPVSKEAEPLVVPQSPLVINIRRDGTVVLDQMSTTLEELEKRLRKAYSQRRGREVIIRGDGRLMLQKCVDVIDVVKRVGFTKYTLKARN